MHFVQYSSFALLGACVCVLLYNNGDRWNYSRETFKEALLNGTKEYMKSFDLSQEDAFFFYLFHLDPESSDDVTG